MESGKAKKHRPKSRQLDRCTVEQYLANERAIREAERSSPHVLSQLEVKIDALNGVCQNLERLQKQYADVEALVEKEKGDVDQLERPDLRSYLMEQGALDERASKEQAEYLDALQKQEIAKQELDEATRQKDILVDEVEELRLKTQHQRELLTKQDSLLVDIFGGEYGSQLENQLEQELDTMEEQRARIMEAHFKWRQAQLMMEYACRQMAVAVKKWRDLGQIPHEIDLRYPAAEETRNNLVAAAQNMTGAQRYIHSISLPYCTPDEVTTLTRATTYVFTDMQSDERYQHALQCYDATHKRAAALLQWLDQVLNGIIRSDLAEITASVRETSLLLRQERARLIKQKAQELWAFNVDENGDDSDSLLVIRDEDEELAALMSQTASDTEIAKTTEKLEGQARAKTPPPLKPDEMAPPPGSEAIFGANYLQVKENINAMTSEHEQHLSQYMNGQSRQTARAQEDLQAKLNSRRQNRAMRNLEQRQLEELTNVAR